MPLRTTFVAAGGKVGVVEIQLADWCWSMHADERVLLVEREEGGPLTVIRTPRTRRPAKTAGA